MSLIEHSELPTFKRLKDDGENILSIEQAKNQDIREIHIGFVNLMPDSAIKATERQFFRLIGRSNQITQIFIHPIYLDNLNYTSKIKSYFKQYYKSFNQIKNKGLDALIITGANIVNTDQENIEKIETGVYEIIQWFENKVTSILLSCFSSHIVLKKKYGIKKKELKQKYWGIFEHKVSEKKHPLVRGMNTKLDIPHSRLNTILDSELEKRKIKTLIQSGNGFHLATSEDGIKYIFLQGHPEYDTISLLKEYKREVKDYYNNKKVNYPIFPDNFFTYKQRILLEEFAYNLKRNKMTFSDFPEQWLTKDLVNSWHDSALCFYNNWLGCVYHLTNFDRNKTYMDTINQYNPLRLKN